MAAIIITDSQNCPLALAGKDKKGNPVTFAAGSIVWSIDNPNLATVTVDPTDSSKALVSAVGPLGDGTVSFTGTDSTGGTVAGSAPLTVQSGALVTVDIVPGTPVEQP